MPCRNDVTKQDPLQLHHKNMFMIAMKSILVILFVCSLFIECSSLSVFESTRQKRTNGGVGPQFMLPTSSEESSRRTFLSSAVVGVASSTLLSLPSPVNAIPMVSTDEFNTILRDSARSIDVVEFSGPKSETVTVVLVDGTTFGINDIIESSTDPRSPLKIAAMCKANLVPYKFVNIEAVLNATPRKKKMYTNARVLEAAEKEREKSIRMQQDEEIRQQQLREMQ
jgi:hypothetical protein